MSATCISTNCPISWIGTLAVRGCVLDTVRNPVDYVCFSKQIATMPKTCAEAFFDLDYNHMKVDSTFVCSTGTTSWDKDSRLVDVTLSPLGPSVMNSKTAPAVVQDPAAAPAPVPHSTPSSIVSDSIPVLVGKRRLLQTREDDANTNADHFFDGNVEITTSSSAFDRSGQSSSSTSFTSDAGRHVSTKSTLLVTVLLVLPMVLSTI